MTLPAHAADGARLAWNHEDHFIVTTSTGVDGTTTLDIPQAAFMYRDGTDAMSLLEVAERVDGRWLCVGCRNELAAVCPCLIPDSAQPDDPF
jgi:hypothetical protein